MRSPDIAYYLPIGHRGNATILHCSALINDRSTPIAEVEAINSPRAMIYPHYPEALTNALTPLESGFGYDTKKSQANSTSLKSDSYSSKSK
jgi:hypothetical protein